MPSKPIPTTSTGFMIAHSALIAAAAVNAALPKFSVAQVSTSECTVSSFLTPDSAAVSVREVLARLSALRKSASFVEPRTRREYCE